MSRRKLSSLSYIERCAYEVQWYEKHGQYPERIRKDYLGHRYVQSDHTWNHYHSNKIERVGHAIANFINEKATGIKT